MQTIICNDCPCKNDDIENGSNCNIGYSMDFKEIDGKFYDLSDDCELEKIVLRDGTEIIPAKLEL